MIRILLLSKNVLSEQELLQKLQRLNFEVFTSSSTLHSLIAGDPGADLADYFSVVILSETISCREVQTVLPRLVKEGRLIFRKADRSFVEEEKSILSQEQITDWMYSEASTEEIRELIASPFYTMGAENPVTHTFTQDQFSKVDNKQMENVLASLSASEFKIFQKLKQERGHTVAREELCQLLWAESTQSRMVQLSSLIKNMRVKFKANDIDGEIIQTVWRKGYILKQ
ncbi:helix-turn-helix domain-containing protein [Candidatus Enterococcus ferrettii]|uniref:OmpR/PhoB-type domain-containing protein n=1 Tax=Candidatus Enterococcus ferrettii TaxID=2815324 RepID=A0ABV0EIM5_9ENTE|nr:helix-turn-helix domain-containing protein [Enterococcus sp. 665A]MBO1340502.1 helix-turn-helix domain-containing protein [Enterococcus sp. 665A]